MWPFTKKAKEEVEKEQVYYFKYDWDKVQSLDDVKIIMQHYLPLNYVYGTKTQLQSSQLRRFIKESDSDAHS